MPQRVSKKETSSTRPLLALLAFSTFATAQTEMYTPYKNIGMWSADTLYVGASFIRLNALPIRVSLKVKLSLLITALVFTWAMATTGFGATILSKAGGGWKFGPPPARPEISSEYLWSSAVPARPTEARKGSV